MAPARPVIIARPRRSSPAGGDAPHRATPAQRATSAFISAFSATVAILIMGLLPVNFLTTPFVFLSCFTTVHAGYYAATGYAFGGRHDPNRPNTTEEARP